MQDKYIDKNHDDILNLNFDSENKIEFQTFEDMIFTDNRVCESLDGVWGFTPDVFRTVTRKKLYIASKVDEMGRALPLDLSFEQMEKVTVPGSWNCDEEKYKYYEGESVYVRNFTYEQTEQDEKVYLRIGAANYECRIWLNGNLLARHQGGFTPFYVELSKHIKYENQLLITVNNRREIEQVPSMNYDWFNYGGITREISLYKIPNIFIKDFHCGLVNESNGELIEVRVKVSGVIANEACTVAIDELCISEKIELDEDGNGKAYIKAKPELWSPKSPKLYHVVVNYGKDQVEDHVGFREISIEGKTILLNGEKIFLKGICCHEESSKGGRTLTDEERLKIIKTAKDMGCNVLRLAHYTHSERMAKLADREGLLLWEEIPVYWALEFSNKETYKNAQNQLLEMMQRDKNRASVIIWSVGNENPDTDDRLTFMRDLIETCKKFDKTRLVSAACLTSDKEKNVNDRLAEYVDIVSFNEYYGWYIRDYDGIKKILDNVQIKKPIVITETGAGAAIGYHGKDEELFTEEHQEKVYKMQIEYTKGKLQGYFPWILYDFVSPIRMNEYQKGKNIKGIIGMDKNTKKKAYYTLKKYYSEME